MEGKLRNIDAWQIIGVPSGQRTQDHNERLGASMRRLGWERSKRRFGGAPEWCYVRGRGSLPQIEVVVVEGQPKVVPFCEWVPLGARQRVLGVGRSRVEPADRRPRPY